MEKQCSLCDRKATRFKEISHHANGKVFVRNVTRCGFHGRQYSNEFVNVVYTKETES